MLFENLTDDACPGISISSTASDTAFIPPVTPDVAFVQSIMTNTSIPVDNGFESLDVSVCEKFN